MSDTSLPATTRGFTFTFACKCGGNMTITNVRRSGGQQFGSSRFYAICPRCKHEPLVACQQEKFNHPQPMTQEPDANATPESGPTGHATIQQRPDPETQDLHSGDVDSTGNGRGPSETIGGGDGGLQDGAASAESVQPARSKVRPDAKRTAVQT